MQPSRLKRRSHSRVHRQQTYTFTLAAHPARQFRCFFFSFLSDCRVTPCVLFKVYHPSDSPETTIITTHDVAQPMYSPAALPSRRQTKSGGDQWGFHRLLWAGFCLIIPRVNNSQSVNLQHYHRDSRGFEATSAEGGLACCTVVFTAACRLCWFVLCRKWYQGLALLVLSAWLVLSCVSTKSRMGGHTVRTYVHPFAVLLLCL